LSLSIVSGFPLSFVILSHKLSKPQTLIQLRPFRWATSPHAPWV
jgi:hypothetical protein